MITAAAHEKTAPLLSSGEIKQLVDPFLGNDYDCDEMERMTLAASLCTRTSSHSRPEMSLVRKHGSRLAIP